MSVKIKMVIGFLVILAMVIAQSYIIVSLNSKRDILSSEALTLFQQNLVMKDRFIDTAILDVDIYRKIQERQILTLDKDSMVRTNGVGVSMSLQQWYDAYVISREYINMNDALKQMVVDMKPLIAEIRAGVVEVRKLPPVQVAQRMNVYQTRIQKTIVQIQALFTDFVGNNSQYFTTKNNSILEYSSRMVRYQAMTIGACLIFIIMIIFYAQYILRPLNWLMEGVHAILNGDLTYHVRKRGNDELGQLADQFNNMQGEIKNHRLHLEDLVEKRTLQLLEAKEELEKTNDSLTQTNRSLEEARRIMDLDMNMAINVQSSFFVKRAPVSGDWEISFVFKPMSGVAGDLYDFYTDDEGNVLGLSMMDVSGHGIASGLITMIAKTISNRVFHQFYNTKKLNQILEDINEELINELGNVDNYLTGIMLKFHDELVEYVNAGHTELLIKRADVKKSAIINPSETKGFKGLFLGLEAMKMPFSLLSFKMKKNDVLFIFSDCLNESTNGADEEFGIERILQSMNDSNGTTAAEVMNHVINDFYKFTGTDVLNDDLTVIAVRRLT